MSCLSLVKWCGVYVEAVLKTIAALRLAEQPF